MPQDDPQQPWQWDETTWRGHVEEVRAGRNLLPPEGPDGAGRWPGGARVAVAISFDSDHETPALRDGETSPGRMAMGEYGARAAVPRILRLLDRYEAPSSFYIPAVCALLRPDEAPTYVEHGHEVRMGDPGGRQRLTPEPLDERAVAREPAPRILTATGRSRTRSVAR